MEAGAPPPPQSSFPGADLSPGPQVQMEAMFSKFAELLGRGLTKTASKITGEIKADLLNLGSRIEFIETKLEHTVIQSSQHSDRLQELHEQLGASLLKIDDLENRSRRYNFRIRGVPESFQDIPAAVQSIIKELLPDIAPHKLELDRVHRALQYP